MISICITIKTQLEGRLVKAIIILLIALRSINSNNTNYKCSLCVKNI